MLIIDTTNSDTSDRNTDNDNNIRSNSNHYINNMNTQNKQQI